MPSIPQPASAGSAHRLILGLGATGMFASVSIDVAVVAARLFRLSLPGSTEVIQYGVVAASCAALCVATIARGHAEVHLITGRLSPRSRTRLGRFGSAMLGLLFLVLAVATAWLLLDTLGEPERSDLLRLPILPLRLALLATTTGLAILCWRRVFVPERAAE